MLAARRRTVLTDAVLLGMNAQRIAEQADPTIPRMTGHRNGLYGGLAQSSFQRGMKKLGLYAFNLGMVILKITNLIFNAYFIFHIFYLIKSSQKILNSKNKFPKTDP